MPQKLCITHTCAVVVCVVKGADSMRALLSTHNPRAGVHCSRGSWFSAIHICQCWRQASYWGWVCGQGGVVWGKICWFWGQATSVSISVVPLCWGWPLAACFPTHSLCLFSYKMRVGLELGWIFLYMIRTRFYDSILIIKT